jgi:hypothetical protein
MTLKHNITKREKVIRIEQAKNKNCWSERELAEHCNGCKKEN